MVRYSNTRQPSVQLAGTIKLIKYKTLKQSLNNVKMWLSAFRRDVDEICALLGYDAA